MLTKLGRKYRFGSQSGAVRAASVETDLDILKRDPLLEQHRDHLLYRWSQYQRIKSAIEDAEGSLLNFAEGYKRFGIVHEGGRTVYREWAPAASALTLIGDFNDWQGTPMEKDEYGVWSVSLPDRADGTPAIAHGSRVKVRLQHWDGWHIDLVPAWISYAVMPQREGATFDGVHWNPPHQEKHAWQYPKPPRPNNLRIYEAHVGMSSEEPVVASYSHFKDNVLPRIAAQGYNCVQLMAVQEHPYYGSFGYHVTNPFAPASRSGNPEELKALVDAAHGLGITVLLDVVHSHICKNQLDGLAGFDIGQAEDCNYFLSGDAGYHAQWDSRLFNYKNWEVLRYLLSNLRWWMEEFQFDGFRFDGVTSMLYHHHGINTGFSGNYDEYFSMSSNVDACVYLMLANDLIHTLKPDAVSIAEDVSGMPVLGRPVDEGGLGFDYRLGMAIPDRWIDLLKNSRDEHWSMTALVSTLCNRRYSERTVAYSESHDQSIVGDKTNAFWLMDAEMYTGMSTLQEESDCIRRGMALHKMIRLLTMCLGGEAWLNFMGNEFGHPEWIDFPREGNGWSHQYCRRQWNLADADHLRYKFLNEWDRAMNALDDRYAFVSDRHQIVSEASDDKHLIVAERGPLLFVFNFSPFNDYTDLKVGVGEPGKYKVALDSDAWDYGGPGRVPHDPELFSQPEGVPGVAETNFNNRPHSIIVQAPSRSCVVYKNMDLEHLYRKEGEGDSTASESEAE